MKKERQFLQDLYRTRLFKVPFIELFQKNKDLRRELFRQYLKAKLVPEVSLYWENFYNRKELDEMAGGKDGPLYVLKHQFHELLAKEELPEKYNKRSLENTPILIELKEIFLHIEDFKKIVLKGKQYEPKEYAENIIQTIIRRRENITIPKIINVILTDLLNEQENLHIEGQLIFDNEFQFKKRYDISYNEAKANYRELKRYGDNCIAKHFNSLPPELPERVKALFQFIEFLYFNMENFNQYNDLIKELEILDKERNKLNPKNKYTDKLQYDKVQAELESKFKTLQDSTANLIKAKAIELHLCNFDNEPIYSFNGIETDIHNLKRNFRKDHLPVIFRHKSQYLDYRTNTHKSFFSLQIFFEDLDEIAKSLFAFFKDTQRNEFEAFETKAIPVNSLKEAIEGFKKGNTKFTLPNNFLSKPVYVQQPNNQALSPQPKNNIFEFKNHFDNVDTEDVFAHFQTGLVRSKMLSDTELETFLFAAFQEMKQPEKRFKLKGVATKDKVMKVFYQYYKDVAGKPHGKQKDYAGLLGNYFQGYKTSTVSSNFAKSVY